MDQRPPRPPPPKKRGTVTSLSSVFPAEEAQKASQRVLDTLGERQKQLDQLRDFVADNTSIINLVKRLPDELHHNIMVPFGKAAFFPGKLIHTNELLVLLGEGYYAERTSKQTVDILKRRGKGLEMQVEAVKAIMEDLKVEASFFDDTAAESAEGLVEIREDYIEDASPQEGSAAGVQMSDSSTLAEAGNTTAAVEDEEYNRILTRLAELEKEEEEAENATKDDEDEESDDDSDHSMSLRNIGEEVSSSEVHHLSNGVESQVTLKDHSDEDYHDHVEAPKRVLSKDGLSKEKGLALSEPNITKKAVRFPEVKERAQSSVTAKQEVEKSEPSPTSSKAFTGVIVERTHNLEVNATNQKGVGQSSKPVSRFKLQRK